jgi:rhodanese-related sulfurtransferase
MHMRTVDVEGLRDLLEKNPYIPLIDVLPVDTFKGQHVPGSACIPLADDDFIAKVSEFVADKNGPLIVYCASCSCSEAATAAQRLEEAGYTAVYEFVGGVEEWRDAGLPMESG